MIDIEALAHWVKTHRALGVVVPAMFDEAIAKLAEIAQQPVADEREGMKLMPPDATESMLAAAYAHKGANGFAAIYRAMFAAYQSQVRTASDQECPHCDGTGDVHDQTGQWLGTCWPCADANLIVALGETAKGCPRFESVLPQPSQFEGHFSTAYLTQQQDELFSLLSPDSVLRLVHLARAALCQPAEEGGKS